MSLRGLAGVRVLGGLGGGGDRRANGTISTVTPDVSLTDGRIWIGVRQTQKALHAVRSSSVTIGGETFGPAPALLSPGRVDGQWGLATERSLLSLIRLLMTHAGYGTIIGEEGGITAEQGSGAAEDRIQVGPLLGRFLATASRFYRPGAAAAPADSTTPPRADLVPDPGTDGADLDRSYDGADLDRSYADTLVVRRGLPWWAWLLLAIGAVGAGYGIWRYYKNRR